MNKILIIFILSFHISYAQGNNKDLFPFKIGCEAKNTESSRYRTFILSIQNNSEQIIYLPRKLNAEPKTFGISQAEINYEVQYCTPTDTLDITKSIRFNTSYHKKDVETVTVRQRNIYYFVPELGVPKAYFSKPGKYRIRFIFNKDNGNTFPLHELYSEWLYIDIK